MGTERATTDSFLGYGARGAAFLRLTGYACWFSNAILLAWFKEISNSVAIHSTPGFRVHGEPLETALGRFVAVEVQLDCSV